MTDVTVPPKTVLDAVTDQALAAMRDARPGLECGGLAEEIILAQAAVVAARIREQFPGAQAGRLLMAVAQAGKALLAEWPEIGGAGLTSVIALAAEQLDREGAAT